MHFRSPNDKTKKLLTGLAGLLYCGAVFADDVSGSDSLLCYGLSAARCEIGEACEAVAPWQLNLPDFVKLDLRGKRIQTTAGSAEQRETPLQTVQRSNGNYVRATPAPDRLPAPIYFFCPPKLSTQLLMISMGSGNTIVVFFSTPISVKVCK